MRREPKSFTVEVKRRPTAIAKKPKPFLETPPEPAPQPMAEHFFRASEPVAEPDEPRRILPCLVTEAAMETAKAEELSQVEQALAPRPRGRPRKQANPEDVAPLPPRKRGRPRKTPAAVAEPAAYVFDDDDEPVRSVAPLVVVALTQSDRAIRRRSDVAGLPRGDRWKRRLPKTLR